MIKEIPQTLVSERKSTKNNSVLKSTYYNHLKTALKKIRIHLLTENKIKKYPLTTSKDMIAIISMLYEIPIPKGQSFNDWLVLLYRSDEYEFCRRD